MLVKITMGVEVDETKLPGKKMENKAEHILTMVRELIDNSGMGTCQYGDVSIPITIAVIVAEEDKTGINDDKNKVYH